MCMKKQMVYLAGPMESVSQTEMSCWRNRITKELSKYDISVYDPVVQESLKNGKEATEQVKHLTDLKKEGNWKQFYKEMFRIWFGTISPNTDIVQVLHHLRMKKHIETDNEKYFRNMGDAEAVVRSDFVIVYAPNEVKMVGTLFEVTIAFLFNVPMYMIIPDGDNTTTNSSLLFGNQISNYGKLKSFSNIDECLNKIKEDFELRN